MRLGMKQLLYAQNRLKAQLTGQEVGQAMPRFTAVTIEMIDVFAAAIRLFFKSRLFTEGPM